MKLNIAPHYRGRKKGKRGGGEQCGQRLALEVFATGTDQVSVVSHSLPAPGSEECELGVLEPAKKNVAK